MYAFWLLILELSQLFWRYIYNPIEKSGLEFVKINLVDLFVYFWNLVRGWKGGGGSGRGEKGEEGMEGGRRGWKGGGGGGRGEEGEEEEQGKERRLQWIQWRCFVKQGKSRSRPWGFFFFRESFLFAVKFFRLPWVFFFLPWGSSFCRESFSFASSLFFCREVISFAVTLVCHRTDENFQNTN